MNAQTIPWTESLWRGFTLRCPNCGQGKMFTGLLSMNRDCEVCGVRYERQSGESIGGMYFNLILAELTTMGGFFIADGLWHPPFTPHVIFWATYNVLFCLFFYRHARGMWVGVSHATGGLKPNAPGSEE